MASLGQLTAGIAHEIKNPLNFVNNFASLSVELLDELKETAASAFATVRDRPARRHRGHQCYPDHQSGEDCRTRTARRRHCPRYARTFARHVRGAAEVDLNTLVDDALNLAYHGARAQDQSFNISLERDFGPRIAPIELTPQDVTRVLLNLFGNAFYATRKRAERARRA